VIRLVAALTVAFGALTLLTALATMMVAVPLAMVTMITGFCWYAERPRTPRRNGLCGGCRAGCVECRERIDCLAGLEKYYGLQFGKFTPVDIGLRYEVLDKGDADLSILFTSDAQLFVDSDKYTLLEDDKGVLPAGNVIFISDQKVADEAGPDYQATIEKVQEGLTLEVMQELNARVDVDKEKPEDVAAEYLQEAGYTN